jgi:hypothetical protein
MTDLETLVRAELEHDVPPIPAELRDWEDVLGRSGERRRRRLRRRAATVALAGAVLAALALTPLVGAIARGVGGFSDWLVGTPGEPVPREAQERFRAVTRFPDDPELRLLLRVDRGQRAFFLYGFETGNVVCLRVAVRAPAPEGAQSACVSRDDLRRSGDLILPVKANLGVEQIGPLPRTPSDPPTVPRYRLTFGIAAAEVARVTVETDDGRSAARVGNGAFLHVFEPERRGNWARSAVATAPGRSDAAPLSVQAGGEPSLATGLPLRGPAAVEREVVGGSIGWFDRREARGVSARDGGLDPTRCCAGYVRVIHPDPGDFLAVAIGDRTLWARFAPRLRPAGEEQICFGLVTRGTVGTGCRPKRSLFERGPLSLSWGFSGSGQQIWIVHGLVSDEVSRLRVFVGSGETWDAPLRDNATAFRVQRAKFPLRLVAYDREGRIVGIQSIRNG